MLFPTIGFTIFFVIFLAIWRQFGSSISAKEWLLGLATVVFYGVMHPLMLAYLAGWVVLLKFSESKSYFKLGVGFAILQLIFWKTLEITPHPEGWITPLGLSFFTFQGLTYLFQQERWSILRLFAFCGFFPTVVSGPICRAKQWREQLETGSAIATESQINYGFVLIILGLLYKLCFAAWLEESANLAFSFPQDNDAALSLIGMISYTGQIYADFAGYSLMALGVGNLMGWNIPQNFDRPYFSRNLQDFWRRWHMSFSGWLKDYVYIKLGGNRGSSFFKFKNIFLTFFICGAWHGLNAHYLAWGVWNALGLIALAFISFELPAILAWCINILFVVGGWVLFRANSLDDAWYFMQSLSGNFKWDPTYLFPLLAFAGVMLIQYFECFIINASTKLLMLSKYVQPLIWGSAVGLVILLSPAGMPNFIYANF